ncbi:MAG: hypothetical protein AAFV77_06005 [Planctomycetota bacterium]
MFRKGSTTSIVIATIAGLSVLGIAGYRMMAGDCGSCAITGAEAATVATHSEGDCGGCAMCSGEGEVEATLVAVEGKDCADACGDSCGDKASCDSDCGAACSGEAAEVEMISTTAESGDCADVCGDACAGKDCGTDSEACCGGCDKAQELAKAPQ